MRNECLSTYACKCALSAQFMAGCVCMCACGGVYRAVVGDKGTHWPMPARFDRECVEIRTNTPAQTKEQQTERRRKSETISFLSI